MNPLRKTLIINKLAQMDCASLADAEIMRCFSGCCAPNKLTRLAIEMVASDELTMEHIRKAL